jgi:flagellar basal body-associated protein FliL
MQGKHPYKLKKKIMKTKIKIALAALSVALLMVFSFNVFSQGQEGKKKGSGCMAMMQDEAQMKECMAMMGEDEKAYMSMMESKEMKEMCSKMMASMKGHSSMCNMHMDSNKDVDKKEGAVL